MSMLAEFLDITKDSREIFEGLAIMDTEYAGEMNKTPVIYLSFKGCTGDDLDTLKYAINDTLFNEYDRYYNVLSDYKNKSSGKYRRFINFYEEVVKNKATWDLLSSGITILQGIIKEYFGLRSILLIDEYDQPIMSSHENKYHDRTKDFFSRFYGNALKGQADMKYALLTGIQRVAKESIFSKLNNITVYTVLDKAYVGYFGFDTEETRNLLEHYGLVLNDEVKNLYDGYLFSGTDIYNPWSILNYADSKELMPYWINTSTNYLIKKSLEEAGDAFKEKFDRLIIDESVNVYIDLETSFIELTNNSTLWGLLVNSGYLTIKEIISKGYVKVRVPNNEVNTEFQKIVSEQVNIQDEDLNEMMFCLTHSDIDGFLRIYRNIVLSCTSYHDARESSYHMLFLGMCVSMRRMYRVSSNIESGHGRSDIIMQSLREGMPHVIIEFKQGEDIDRLKEEALTQIMEKEYYTGLKGDVLCIGLAHDVKKCELAHKLVRV